jgi:hypothetical protein
LDLDKPVFDTRSFGTSLNNFRLSEKEGAVSGQFPIPELRNSAGAIGSINGRSDSDGIFRRMRLFTLFDNKAVPELSAASLLMNGESKEITYNAKLQDGKVVKDDTIGYCSTNKVFIFFGKEGFQSELYMYHKTEGEYSSAVYKYDENYNLIEQGVYTTFGDLGSRTIYKYDDRGNLIERCNYYNDEELSSKEAYKYDKKGNCIEKQTFDLTMSSVRDIVSYKYNRKGFRTESILYDGDSLLVFRSINKYNRRGEMIEELDYNSDGGLDMKTTCDYNNKGNLIEVCRYIGASGCIDYKYNIEYFNYDSFGNWTEKVEYEGVGEIETTITERQIEYYEQ